MAKKEEEYLSKNAYAQYLGINEKAIRNAIAVGKIKKGYDTVKQKVIKRIADKEFGHLHKVAKVRPGVSSVKLADKLKSEESPKKSVQNSDNSEQISKPKPVPKKNKIKSEVLDQNSEEDNDEDDDFEYLFEDGLSHEDIIKTIKITPSLEYGEAMRRREILSLVSDKIKLEENQGSLVKIADVNKALYVVADQIKKALQAIPNRCADEVLHADNKVDVINIMTKEITNALVQLSDLENFKISK